LKPKRIICIILFALLFLTAFPSCGEKDKESETNTVNAFKEKLIKLPDNYSIGPGNSNLAVYGDRVFADIEKILKNDVGREYCEPCLVSWSETGEDFREETEAAVEPCIEGARVMSSFKLDGDYLATYEWYAKEPEFYSRLCMRDKKGKTLFSINLTEILGYDIQRDRENIVGDIFKLNGAAAYEFNSKMKFAAATSSGVACFDIKGELLWKLDKINSSSIVYSNERLLLFENTHNGVNLFELDINSGKKGDAVELPGELTSTLAGDGSFVCYGEYDKYAFFYKNNIALWGISLSSDDNGKLVCIAERFIDWNDSDIDGNYTDLYIKDRDTVYGLYLEVFNECFSVLTRMSEEEFANRTTLTIASIAFYPNTIYDAAVKYSRANPGKHINIDDYYNKYNGDIELAKTHLDLEIASGNIPDMIFTAPQNSNLLLYKHYIDSGVFADLNPLLDSVDGFDRNDLLGYLTKPYTDKNGCQYVIPIHSINGTYFSNGSIHGPVTAEELIEIYDTMPEDTDLITDFLTFYFLYGCIDDFIDYEKATCCFDDGRFEKILRFCREAESKGTNRSYNKLKRAELYELVKEGKLLMIDIPQIRSPISWALLKNDFGGALVPVGYPNVKKKIIASLSAGINTFIGITKASQHKDIAADFISTFYSIPDIDINEYGINRAIGREDFSIKRSRIYALVKMLEDYTIIDEYTVVPDSEADNYTGIKIKLTYEDADEFIAYLDSITTVAKSTGPVWELIWEEINTNPGVDPADIAKYIQDRVSIYLSEQS
jgi:hypothetical protein